MALLATARMTPDALVWAGNSNLDALATRLRIAFRVKQYLLRSEDVQIVSSA